jgi:hypothetical protein
VHNDRDTTWAGCGDLYHSLTLPDGQSATPGVSTSLEQGVSTGDVEAGQTATCRHYWLTPASWAGKPIRVKVEVGPDLRSMTWQGTAPS